MSEAWSFIDGAGDTRALIIADHASNRIPDGIDLGIAAERLRTHIAIDLGVEPLARALSARLGIPAILGNVSRLVVDFNREADAPHIIPIASDGHAITGNAVSHAVRQVRIERYWEPYHAKIGAVIAERRPHLLVSLHSFTPKLETRPHEDRPWEIGILYNQDDRAARIAIPMLAAGGAIVGDQEPYSGVLLNATMNQHGEANGIAYLGIEMRQDMIADAAGVARWAERIAPVIIACVEGISETGAA